MTSNILTSEPPRTWQEIVCEVEHEEDPLRVRTLARELNEAMLVEERMRVAHRLRAPTRAGDCGIINPA
jgi:hypothetical protein